MWPAERLDNTLLLWALHLAFQIYFTLTFTIVGGDNPTLDCKFLQNKVVPMKYPIKVQGCLGCGLGIRKGVE